MFTNFHTIIFEAKQHVCVMCVLSLEITPKVRVKISESKESNENSASGGVSGRLGGLLLPTSPAVGLNGIQLLGGGRRKASQQLCFLSGDFLGFLRG